MSPYGVHPSEETRRKISESLKGNIISPETRAKIAAANKGHIVSEETRRKIGLAHKGKVLSQETKYKIGKAHRGGPGNPGKRSEEFCIKMRGKNSPVYGKGYLFVGRKGKKSGEGNSMDSPIARAKVSRALMGHKINVGTHRSPETRLKMSKSIKRSWKLPDVAMARQKSLHSPTWPEVIVADALWRLNLIPDRFEYNGRGGLYVDGLTPDFIWKERAMVILVNGEYYHTQGESDKKVARYQSEGYRVLVVWEREVRPVYDSEAMCRKIVEFVRGAPIAR